MHLEKELFKDVIILQNLGDTYNDLSKKSFGAMEWASKTSCRYFLKVDHDIYVKVPELLQHIQLLGNQDFHWTGLVYRYDVHRSETQFLCSLITSTEILNLSDVKEMPTLIQLSHCVNFHLTQLVHTTYCPAT